MTLHGGVRVFGPEEMFQIHQAALSVLWEVGLELDLGEVSLARLARRGLQVDPTSRRVRFPEEVILETIRQLSGAPTERIGPDGVAKPPQPLRMPTRLQATVGSYHGFVYDVSRGAMRPAGHQDMVDFLKVKRRLANVDASSAGICPQDVPQPVASVHAAAFAVRYCDNPSAPEVSGLEDLVWVERVMQAAGAWTADRHRTLPIYPISPLRLAGRGAQIMEYQANRGDLTFVLGMVIPGASSPVTPAGHVVVVLAEELGFNTAYRLLVDPPNDRFAPRSIGDDVCILDMRSGSYVLSGPEVALLRLATHQMAGEFYKMPGHSDHGVRFFADAQEPGVQASTEGALMAMSDLCAGVYSYEEDVCCTVGILGSLGGNLSICLEQAVMDHEVVQFLQHYTQGVRVDAETLALDLIAEIGPGGSFLATDHTARHAKAGMWYPGLWHRGPWDQWLESGRRTPLDQASERIRTWLREDLDPVLDEARMRDVDRVVREAERSLLG